MATQTQVLKRGAVQPARLHDYLYGWFIFYSYAHKISRKYLFFRSYMYIIWRS